MVLVCLFIEMMDKGIDLDHFGAILTVPPAHGKTVLITLTAYAWLQFNKNKGIFDVYILIVTTSIYLTKVYE